jgi:hypothetical protein
LPSMSLWLWRNRHRILSAAASVICADLCIRTCNKRIPLQHRRKHDCRTSKSDRTEGRLSQAQARPRARSCGNTTASYHHHGCRDRDA